MSKKHKLNHNELKKTQEEIANSIPQAVHVDVHVNEVKNHVYKSVIKVDLPPKKTLVAVKKGRCLHACLESARAAIFKQLEKRLKTKKRGFKIMKEYI